MNGPDLTGNKYDRLIVISFVGCFKGHNKWLCKCECGNTIEKFSTNLLRNKQNTCGCHIREKEEAIINSYIGKRYGRLTIQEYSGRKRSAIQYLCLCDCGNTKVIYLLNLIRGDSTSCGCYRDEQFKKRSTKHGKYINGNRKDPERDAWRKMLNRCYKPQDNRYHRYGARGIIVCERWKESFDNFFSDMGKRPSSEHSLDRIDNNGNYEPSNCRWATEEIQKRNRSNNHWIEYNGEKKILSDWARKIGVSCSHFNNAFRRGETFEAVYERLKNRKK